MVFCDSSEACLLQTLDLQAILDDREGCFGPNSQSTLPEEVAPSTQMCLVGHCSVIRLVESVALKGFDKAARLEDAVGLTEELGPVFDGTNEPAEVNIVERVVLERPLPRVVINLAISLTISTCVQQCKVMNLYCFTATGCITYNFTFGGSHVG